eukprot:CAMPEP_0205920906 /NCGR_PEP_ID=MMETSP1325-20131115/11954_1 /ASSEMBLY_ACC=CAM_ASM_000708 /TAXON_ID=236786 /ORGANISM="Florenciella sp., Strain RCC1007" /LENGTH=93 /DNA_ID=CAMNT_0053288645 /DNA_START=20 /DNA_END=300 /DNA_ORIENTATION=+
MAEAGGGEVAAPANSQDLTIFVQSLLEQMQSRFTQMSDQIIGRIDEMGGRIDDLEKSITDLMDQAGVDPVASAGGTTTWPAAGSAAAVMSRAF